MLGAFFIRKFVHMKEPNTSGALSLNDTLVEVEGWTAEFYQRVFNEALDQQPYIFGTLMDVDEGMDEFTHSWMLKSVLALKWAFQKMGWRQTMLGEEKWHQLLESKMESYENHQEDEGLAIEAIIKDNGGKVVKSVSKTLDYLVVGESAGSKYDKAQQLNEAGANIQIISETDLTSLITP